MQTTRLLIIQSPVNTAEYLHHKVSGYKYFKIADWLAI